MKFEISKTSKLHIFAHLYIIVYIINKLEANKAHSVLNVIERKMD